MSADTRKGLVFVEVGDDDLIHFKWKDRTKGNKRIDFFKFENCSFFNDNSVFIGDVEDDLIIFQDDVEYNQVKQCTDGRVFVLKLKSSNAKHFFWMQVNNAPFFMNRIHFVQRAI
jgi:26S proteasome regulatory subunit N13